MYKTLAIVVVAIVSMVYGASVGQAYGQANMTGGNMTAMTPDGNMTAGENATVRGGVSGVGSGEDGDDGDGGGTNLAVNDPGAEGSKPKPVKK